MIHLDLLSISYVEKDEKIPLDDNALRIICDHFDVLVFLFDLVRIPLRAKLNYFTFFCLKKKQEI